MTSLIAMLATAKESVVCASVRLPREGFRRTVLPAAVNTLPAQILTAETSVVG